MGETREQAPKSKQILDAARRVFAAAGYYQTRVEDIAREAGVGKGTVYEYYAGKEELYLEMLLEIADSYVTGVAAEIDQTGDIRDVLHRIGRHLHGFLMEHGQLARMVLQDPGPVNRELQQRLVMIRKNVVEQVAALITKAGTTGRIRQLEAGVAARFFLGGLAGVVLSEVNGELAPPEVLESAVQLFMQGIEGDAPGADQ